MPLAEEPEIIGRVEPPPVDLNQMVQDIELDLPLGAAQILDPGKEILVGQHLQ